MQLAGQPVQFFQQFAQQETEMIGQMASAESLLQQVTFAAHPFVSGQYGQRFGSNAFGGANLSRIERNVWPVTLPSRLESFTLLNSSRR